MHVPGEHNRNIFVIIHKASNVGRAHHSVRAVVWLAKARRARSDAPYHRTMTLSHIRNGQLLVARPWARERFRRPYAALGRWSDRSAATSTKRPPKCASEIFEAHFAFPLSRGLRDCPANCSIND